LVDDGSGKRYLLGSAVVDNRTERTVVSASLTVRSGERTYPATVSGTMPIAPGATTSLSLRADVPDQVKSGSGLSVVLKARLDGPPGMALDEIAVVP
jgi:hypothetical protein